jgi:hypothetical protein
MLEGKELKRRGFMKDEAGRLRLADCLRKSDVAGYEVSSYGNRLARTLREWVGRETRPLNAGEPRIIWPEESLGI